MRRRTQTNPDSPIVTPRGSRTAANTNNPLARSWDPSQTAAKRRKDNGSSPSMSKPQTSEASKGQSPGDPRLVSGIPRLILSKTANRSGPSEAQRPAFHKSKTLDLPRRSSSLKGNPNIKRETSSDNIHKIYPRSKLPTPTSSPSKKAASTPNTPSRSRKTMSLGRNLPEKKKGRIKINYFINDSSMLWVMSHSKNPHLRN